jgi:chromosome segregation ATPase
MNDDDPDRQSLRGRLSRQGEETLGRFAQDLLENPLVSGAISRAFDAREKASAAQEVAFGALNIPSAADLERLTRRVRAVSQRLEGIEDGVDRLDERLATLASAGRLEQRLEAIEEHLAGLSGELSELRKALPDGTEPVPTSQERLEVES